MKNNTDIKSKILMLNLKYENDKKELEKTHNEEVKKLKEKEKTDDVEYTKRLTNIDLLTKEQKYEIFNTPYY